MQAKNIAKIVVGIAVSTIAFIELQEGVRYVSYRDIANKLTIGVGHLESADEQLKYAHARLTKQAVDELLNHDLIGVDATIKRLVKVQLNQNQYDALASFIFEEGCGAFAGSELLKKINAGASEKEIRAAFMNWTIAHVNGHPVKVEDLVKRRGQEADLYFKK